MYKRDYYTFVSDNSFIRQFEQYENFYKNYALSLVPYQKFLEEFADLDEPTRKEIGDEKDYCLIRLLEWFKSDLFTWVDKLCCDRCDQDCDLVGCRKADEINQFNCFNVENYKCAKCNTFYDFPRFNHGGKLLETKRGRCGEWALAFAYLCYVFNYEIRLVFHFDDHVWVEVYSNSHQRWVHCDPCENSYDNPLLYECGWNKTSSLIIAYGMHEVRDVTWRYSSRWRQTLQNRQRLFDEARMMAIFDRKNHSLQRELNQSQRDLITQRWLAELTQLIRNPEQEVLQIEPKSMQSRISGSIQWRLSRGETSRSLEMSNYVFSTNSVDVQQLNISYDCRQDNYLVGITKREAQCDKPIIIDHWNAACFRTENIDRIVEKDWNMCYLSRNKHCNAKHIGRISWRVRSTNWKSIQILIRGQTFESGVIELQFVYGTIQKSFNLNEMFEINRQDLKNDPEQTAADAEHFDVEATLMFGEGSVAWQHAQLFRQTIKTRIRESMLQIIVKY